MTENESKNLSRYGYQPPEETIYAVRCEICMQAVEDFTNNGERCKNHIDSELILSQDL